MGSLNWFIAVLKKYIDFTGRARRKEYWNFILVASLSIITLMVIEELSETMTVKIFSDLKIGLFSGIYVLLLFCPLLAVTARRLHDTNRSGWWQLLSLIPLLGMVVVMIFTSEDSYHGENRYGKNPKGKIMFISY